MTDGGHLCCPFPYSLSYYHSLPCAWAKGRIELLHPLPVKETKLCLQETITHQKTTFHMKDGGRINNYSIQMPTIVHVFTWVAHWQNAYCTLLRRIHQVKVFDFTVLYCGYVLLSVRGYGRPTQKPLMLNCNWLSSSCSSVSSSDWSLLPVRRDGNLSLLLWKQSYTLARQTSRGTLFVASLHQHAACQSEHWAMWIKAA